MASRRRATHSEASTYIGPDFDPSRVLLRRVFFLNDEKSRYVSVGFYPTCNYQPFVEFGGTRILPLVLPTDYVNVVTEQLPGLVERMCRNEQFAWCSEDGDFKIHTTRAYRTARFTYAKHWISLKLPELRTLKYIFHVITNQLKMFNEGLCDVRAYVHTAMASCDFIEPHVTFFKSIIHRQLYDELKSPMYY
jgi:hypothetical protein